MTLYHSTLCLRLAALALLLAWIGWYTAAFLVTAVLGLAVREIARKERANIQ